MMLTDGPPSVAQVHYNWSDIVWNWNGWNCCLLVRFDHHAQNCSPLSYYTQHIRYPLIRLSFFRSASASDPESVSERILNAEIISVKIEYDDNWSQSSPGWRDTKWWPPIFSIIGDAANSPIWNRLWRVGQVGKWGTLKRIMKVVIIGKNVNAFDK